MLKYFEFHFDFPILIFNIYIYDLYIIILYIYIYIALFYSGARQALAFDNLDTLGCLVLWQHCLILVLFLSFCWQP